MPVKFVAVALNMLLALVEGAGNLVTVNDLLTRVWRDVMVDESALRVHVAIVAA